jgi:hypothetical protein
MHLGRLLLIALLLASLWYVLPVFAGDPAPPEIDAATDCAAFDDIQPEARPQWAQAGCCYANGGVCGCSAFGAVMCCDGRLSPTCVCRDGSPITTLASMPE